MQLEGKVVIVTGAARGIGQEYCLGLAREGAKIAAADILPLDETMSRLKQAGAGALAITTDVTIAASAAAMVERTAAHFGRIDGLVNNAGIFGGLKNTPFDQIDEGEWDRVMAVNVKGIWQCCKAVVPVMKRQGKGRIVNVSSGTFWIGVPYLLHYVSSKGAVIALTRALARELAGTNINVNAITPGYTMTDAAMGIADRETVESFKQQIVDLQIVKRNEQPADLTGTVAFLVSDACEFINGQTINVDGGAGMH